MQIFLCITGYSRKSHEVILDFPACAKLFLTGRLEILSVAREASGTYVCTALGAQRQPGSQVNLATLIVNLATPIVNLAPSGPN